MVFFWKFSRGKRGYRKQSVLVAPRSSRPLRFCSTVLCWKLWMCWIHRVQDHLKKLIVHGCIVFIHFGTPCSSFSLARKKDGGPPPLRDQQHLWGLSHLSDSDRQKVLMGNKFMQLTADIIQLCHSHGVGWSLENPAGSFPLVNAAHCGDSSAERRSPVRTGYVPFWIRTQKAYGNFVVGRSGSSRSLLRSRHKATQS